MGKGLCNDDSAGPGAMRNQMKNVVDEGGELSDRYVWSAIQYLDAESTSPNCGKPMLVAVIAFAAVWIVFLTAMCSLTIRAGSTDPGYVMEMKNHGADLAVNAQKFRRFARWPGLQLGDSLRRHLLH
jgi:hypothetical protein